MRILLTNDDGIRGAGLRLLAAWARTLGEVLIVAPKEEQSACSQSIVLRRPFEVAKSDLFADLGIDAYRVDATPADCVRFAMDILGPFDLVFSGINRGFNIGFDIAYSGTCAAATEANYAGVPAVAFSTDLETPDAAAAALPAVWRYFEKNRLLSRGLLFNVNIPAAPKDILLTKQGGVFYRDHFLPCGEGMYRANLYRAVREEALPDLDTDTGAVLAGYCSVTPLTVNRTDLSIMQS